MVQAFPVDTLFAAGEVADAGWVIPARCRRRSEPMQREIASGGVRVELVSSRMAIRKFD